MDWTVLRVLAPYVATPNRVSDEGSIPSRGRAEGEGSDKREIYHGEITSKCEMQEVVQWKKAESGEEHGDSIHSGMIMKKGSCDRRAEHESVERAGPFCNLLRVVFV